MEAPYSIGLRETTTRAMASFKKLSLMAKDELDRLKQRDLKSYNPKLKAVVLLDDEMEDILNRKDLCSEEKMKIFQQAQHRFLSLFKTLDHPALTGVSEQIAPSPHEQPALLEAVPGAAAGAPSIGLPTEVQQHVLEEEPADDDDDDDDTARQLPANPSASDFNIPYARQRKANELLSILNKNPQLIASDRENKLLLKGQVVPGSNYRDLFRELYLRSKDHCLTGQNQFLSALHSLNIDSELISNSHCSKLYNSQASSSMSSSGNSQFAQSGHGRRRSSSTPPGHRPKILHLYRL